MTDLREPVPEDSGKGEAPSRTPFADALHEAYMAGYNDAGTEQDPLDEDAFTEAGIALSRMSVAPVGSAPSPETSEALREALKAIRSTIRSCRDGGLDAERALTVIEADARRALSTQGDDEREPTGGETP